jgi:LysM repeat protein
MRSSTVGRLCGAGGLALVALALLWVSLMPGAVVAQDDEDTNQIHVVEEGENLYSIAARYGVTVGDIVETNNLSNINLIGVGTSLTIPVPPGEEGTIHTVQRGENLAGIAAEYGVTADDIVLANNLNDPNRVYVGQRLFIPVSEPDRPVSTATPEAVSPTSTEVSTATEVLTGTEPAVSPTLAVAAATSGSCVGGCEMIAIISPSPGVTVSNPIQISGYAAGAGQELVVRVLDAAGVEIGLDYATIDADPGEAGPYSATISYTMPVDPQLGRIQVYSLSPRDGAIEHLSSLEVNLEASGLDDPMSPLKEALEAQDYEALVELMTDEWVLGFYQSEGLLVDKEVALAQLERSYLGPGDVRVDLTTDALSLLGDRVEFSADVVDVLYATGWGRDQVDDAFLLVVEDDEGQLRWGGMLYVFAALQDY